MKIYRVTSIIYIDNDEYSVDALKEHIMKFGIPRPRIQSDLRIEEVKV